MPAQPLSPQELEESARLKRLFLSWQNNRRDSGLPASQEDVAPFFGFKQSALNQYLNGKIPLNTDASIRFAKVLGVLIDDFSPTFAARVKEAMRLVSGGDASTGGPPKWMSEDAYRLLDLYYSGDGDAQLEIMSTAAELSFQRPRLARVASNDDKS